ncbi:MAG: pilus assembly protein [Alphaproteobacteria bacterium]|nr:pilus assembly protein [Alphaproteobacteria bacterium]MBV9374070.1 pilus assembly protein [Alphaproteobacteria bacterium]
MTQRTNLRRDSSGLAAIEFALILPIMLLLFLGSFETTNLVLAYMKLEASAEAAADLVAQTRVNTVLQSTDFTNITNAAKQVLTPLPTSGTLLKIAYASVTYSTGTAVIDWHTEINSATAITTANVPNNASLANLGNQTNGSTDSVIIVTLTYSYTSPFTYLLNSSYTLTESAFNRPRYMNCVPTYLNSGNVCP